MEPMYTQHPIIGTQDMHMSMPHPLHNRALVCNAHTVYASGKTSSSAW